MRFSPVGCYFPDSLCHGKPFSHAAAMHAVCHLRGGERTMAPISQGHLWEIMVAAL